jgi:hypothetical protein
LSDIANDNPQYSHIDGKEEDAGGPETRNEGGFAEEFELVALL